MAVGQGRPAVLLVDLQYDFFDVRIAPIGGIQKAACLPGVRQLLSFARQNDWPVIHVVTEHTSSETLPHHLKTKGIEIYCKAGTAGAGIVRGLFSDGDKIITKQGYSGFGRTNLDDVLNDAPQLILAGIATDCCVHYTAFDAACAHGKRVYVPFQATSASTAEAYVSSLKAVWKSLGSVFDLAELPEKRLEDVSDPDWKAIEDWSKETAKVAEESGEEYESLLAQDPDSALTLFAARLHS